MVIKNTTQVEMHEALKALNIKYDNNIIFEYIKPIGRRQQFRLRVKDSNNKGARRGTTGRRMINACWHTHGHYYEELFKVQPDAIIKAAQFTIDKDQGNWQDWNAGSRIDPQYMSELCNCE